MTEEQIQTACVLWFDHDYPEHRQMLFHVDNNSWNMVIGSKKKALGVQAGVSDLILVAHRRVYFLECKTPIGTQKDKQISFEEKVLKRGHVYIIFRSLEEFKSIIWRIIGR